MRTWFTWLSCLSLCLSCSWLAAAEAAGKTIELHEHSVKVAIAVVDVVNDQGVIQATFTPDREDPPLHVYDIHLNDAHGGVATNIKLEPGQSAQATGPLTADVEPHPLGEVSVYPPGPVTLRLPIQLPDGAVGGSTEVALRISYMACTDTSCRRPQIGKQLALQVPTHPRPAAPASGLSRADVESIVAAQLAQQTEVLKSALTIEPTLAVGSTITFRHPKTVAEAEAMIAEAHAQGRSAILDFTGPSCTVCQQMARTVLRDPGVIGAWMSQVPIEINTDRYAELADWQLQQFKTVNRPLYVRIDPAQASDPSVEARWDQVFGVKDEAVRQEFIAWAGGGEGSEVGTGTSLMGFIALAFLGGLFTLVMPCTYPMIPFTVNFFAKQAQAGKGLLPLAFFYAAGIMLCFIGLGLLLTGVLEINLARLSGNPVTNLILAGLFITLGASLLGFFVLQLPSSWQNAVGGGRAGYMGALLMGLTFAVTAFACTAPFAGSVLAAAVSGGTANAWLRAVGGMALYSGTIAVPFFFLAISPGLLTRMPKAGSWMNEFKIIGGLVEIAAALKFLNIANAAWDWGIFGRSTVFSLWAATCGIIAVYVCGWLRLPSDESITHVGPSRLLTALVFFAAALWLASGLAGNDLGLLESFLAPE